MISYFLSTVDLHNLLSREEKKGTQLESSECNLVGGGGDDDILYVTYKHRNI